MKTIEFACNFHNNSEMQQQTLLRANYFSNYLIKELFL